MLKKKLATARRRATRARTSIGKLSTLVQKLKTKLKVSDTGAAMLNSFSDFERELFQNQSRARLFKAKGYRFSDVMK